jgi:uroporphyrinogen-III synthase
MSTPSSDADRPLADWRVLVTRPADQAAPLAAALAAAGATPISYPTIALGPPPSWAAFDAAVATLSAYSWLVFTSPSAARFTVDRAPQLARLLRGPGAPAVAAVGTETARALLERGIAVTLIPDDQRQEGLAAAFTALAAGARVLFPQALGGREHLREVLVARGAHVDVVPISETVPLPQAGAPPPFDVAVFASPSALRAFVAVHTPAALAGKIVAVIGPTTAQAAQTSGVSVQVVPATPSVAALVAALVAYRRGAGDRPGPPPPR